MKVWRYDLHVHCRPTRNGPGAVQAYVDVAVARGLDGICITEHSHTEGMYELPPLTLPDGFIVMQGQEVSTKEFGHVLVYGCCEPLLRNLDMLDDDAAAIHAHPFRKKGGKAHNDYLFTGFEVINGRYNREQITKGEALWHKTHCAGTGGSDAHRARHVGRAWTCFYHPIHNVFELADAISECQCFPGGEKE